MLVLGITLAALGYRSAVRRVVRAGSGGDWPRFRSVGFLAGLALLGAVLMGPIGAYDDTYFWAHMVQHIVLMMLAAPLLLLGAPVLLVLRVVGGPARRRWVVPVLRSRVVRLLTHPLVTWALFAATLLGTHFSPFYNYALTHPPVHRFVEHPLYLAVALLYFYPLIGRNPMPRRVPPIVKALSLLAMMGPESMTGFFLFSSTHVFYPAYLAVDRPFGPAPLFDQQLGGALMWGGGMIISAVWIVVAAREWLRAEERTARRLDQRLRRATAPSRTAEHTVGLPP